MKARLIGRDTRGKVSLELPQSGGAVGELVLVLSLSLKFEVVPGLNGFSSIVLMSTQVRDGLQGFDDLNVFSYSKDEVRRSWSLV